MADMMTFPDTVEEFMEQYKIVDTERVYTNGTELVPIFRMMQWFEHLKPCEDAVSRKGVAEAVEYYKKSVHHILGDCEFERVADAIHGLIRALPSVTPKPEQRWIPCSELPSDNREVEVTCEVRRCDGKRYRYTCHASYVHKYTIESTDYCDWEEADEYNEDEDKYYALPGWYERVHNWDDYSFIAIADFVTAWRELPEPYREVGEQDALD